MRILDISDGFTSETEPTVILGTSSGFSSYADDAAYVAANGAAINGAAYYNSTSHIIKVYINGAWRELAVFEA